MMITTKGQVTIPQDIRERLGLLPNTEVEFTVTGSTVRLTKKVARPGKGRGALAVETLRRHPGTVKMTTDEIMALTRG
jgi:AbrB family looped-hinge helix DNA binding protein